MTAFVSAPRAAGTAAARSPSTTWGDKAAGFHLPWASRRLFIPSSAPCADTTAASVSALGALPNGAGKATGSSPSRSGRRPFLQFSGPARAIALAALGTACGCLTIYAYSAEAHAEVTLALFGVAGACWLGAQKVIEDILGDAKGVSPDGAGEERRGALLADGINSPMAEGAL